MTSFPSSLDHPLDIGVLNSDPSVWYQKVLGLKGYFRHVAEFSTITEDLVLGNGIDLWKNQEVWYFGTPCYCAKNHEDYFRKEFWKMQREVFSELYNEIICILTETFGHKFEITPILSPPGCHVFMGKKGEFFGNNNPHTDLDVTRFLKTDTEKLLSLTVVLSTPTQGGGYLRYTLEEGDYKLEYKSGHLYMWSANLVHQIGNFIFAEDGARCTLQCHIYFHNEVGYLYW